MKTKPTLKQNENLKWQIYTQADYIEDFFKVPQYPAPNRLPTRNEIPDPTIIIFFHFESHAQQIANVLNVVNIGQQGKSSTLHVISLYHQKPSTNP